MSCIVLGSWFVLERWITDSPFRGAAAPAQSDLDVAKGENAKAVLERHWDTWITESDFAYLHSIGINTVRLPIGYWSLGPNACAGTPFDDVKDVYQNSWTRVLRAVKSAEGYGIGVLIDLHGAPGSQNGYDNSGQRTDNPTWGSDPQNVGRTLDIIKFIAEQVGGMIDVLELLNEPAGFDPSIGDVIAEYWKNGYQVVRSAGGSNLKVMIMDAFLGVEVRLLVVLVVCGGVR